jgi:hypothetical protein
MSVGDGLEDVGDGDGMEKKSSAKSRRDKESPLLLLRNMMRR